MNTVSSDSLIHFTNNFKALKSILSNGLRYSYVLEHFQHYAPFPKEFLQKDEYNIEDAVAIPMICFCDIPLNLAQKHSDEYGQFFIAFDKHNLRLALGDKLNPVFYINSEAFYNVKEMLEHKRNDPELSQVFDYILAMSKPVSGCDLKGHFKDFYNEREWRTFYFSNENPYCQWERNIRLKDGDEFHKYLYAKNQIIHQSECAYLNMRIRNDDYIDLFVTYIGIKNDSYRDKLINFIMQAKTIFGVKNISDSTKLKLISKIISFDRIKSDF